MVILLLLSALPLALRAQSVISPCLVPPKGWYSVCQPDATAGGYTCLVSSAWCAPYNQPQYFLSGNTGHRPGPRDRLRVLLDPWSRNSTSANVCNEDVGKCMADILAGKETIGSPVVEKYHVSFVVTSLSYFDLTVPDFYISGGHHAKLVITTGDVQDTSPVCRVLELSGMEISLSNLDIDVSECTTFFDQVPGQFTTGDDGAVIAFVGPSIQAVNMSNILITSTGGYDGYRAVTTGVRIGSPSQSAVSAKYASITDVTVNGLDVAYAIWETVDGPAVTLADALCKGSRLHAGTCALLYSGPGVRYTNISASYGREAPRLWTAHNVTDSLPPDQILAQSAERGAASGGGTCSAHGASASAYITAVMVPLAVIAVCIVIIIVMTHEIHSMKHSKAFIDRYDDVEETHDE